MECLRGIGQPGHAASVPTTAAASPVRERRPSRLVQSGRPPESQPKYRQRPVRTPGATLRSPCQQPAARILRRDRTRATGTCLSYRRPTRKRSYPGVGALSVRVRPSSPKRDCARRTTSTGGRAPANVHAKSRLTLEPLRTLRPETKGQAEPARTGRGPSPAPCGQSLHIVVVQLTCN